MKDNHVHLDLMKDNLEDIIFRAKKAGVNEFIVPGVCGFPNKLKELLSYSEISICWGIHPKFADIENVFENELHKLENSNIKIVAIGECGLDKRFPKEEKQVELFKKQIDLSIALNLPLMIHLIGHWQKAYDILKESKLGQNFVLHSWSGSVEMAKEFIKIGGILSLSSGILKSPKKLSKLHKEIPKEKIIFETDSPDQKPDFIESDGNEPSNLPLIIKRIYTFS